MFDRTMIKQIKSYIKKNYVKEKPMVYSKQKMLKASFDKACFYDVDESFLNINIEVKSTWQEVVFSIIDEKEYKDPEVYKRANLSKQTFSKIRCDNKYQPNKDTAIQMCIGLKLNIDDTLDLLAKAGYTLSNSIKRDLVVRYFIENEIYNVDEMNLVLDEFKLKLFPIN